MLPEIVLLLFVLREANKSQATLGTKHRTKRSKKISGNIGHKTENKEKQTNLRQHWAQNTERREANKYHATLGTKHRTKRR
jgi:ribosomal protein L20A (L18A)